jgi:hypothetical protein
MKGLVFEAGPGGENTRPYLKKQSKTKWAGSMSGGLFPQCLKFITSYCIKKTKKRRKNGGRETGRKMGGRVREKMKEKKEREKEGRKGKKEKRAEIKAKKKA